MPEFLLLSNDVPRQVAANHGKQKGNNDEIYLFDTGVEVVLQGKKLFYLYVKRSEEEKIVNEAGKNKNRCDGQVEYLQITYFQHSLYFCSVIRCWHDNLPSAATISGVTREQPTFPIIYVLCVFGSYGNSIATSVPCPDLLLIRIFP